MNSDYTLHMQDGVGIVTSSLLDEAGVHHGFTTRYGGMSKPPIDTLNLGFNRPEPMETVTENYKRLCRAYDLDFDKLVLVSYVHGNNVIEVTARDCGRGIRPECEPLPDCDGIVTNDPDVVLFTLHADCSAFFVADMKHNAIGLSHAGWRGTYGRIGQKLIEKMHSCYGTRAEDVYAVVGPCICGKCYEVDRSIGEMFINEFGDGNIMREHENPDKAYIDIRLAAEDGFIQAGVRQEHIGHIPCCTYEREELFYSYRRDGRGRTGAMGAFLTLR